MKWSSGVGVAVKKYLIASAVVFGVAALIVIVYELDELPPFKGFL